MTTTLSCRPLHLEPSPTVLSVAYIIIFLHPFYISLTFTAVELRYVDPIVLAIKRIYHQLELRSLFFINPTGFYNPPVEVFFSLVVDPLGGLMSRVLAGMLYNLTE